MTRRQQALALGALGSICASGAIALFIRDRDVLVATSTASLRYDLGDGRAYVCWGRSNLVYAHLPGSDHPWWTIDRIERRIYMAPPPRAFLGTLSYATDQEWGVSIDSDLEIGPWTWQFADRRCRFQPDDRHSTFWCEIEWTD